MRIFLAGATGAIGGPLLRMLIAEGHQVTGMTRSPAKADALRAAGAQPAVADALDSAAVEKAVSDAKPEAVIHQLTAIPQRLDPRKIVRDFALTDRLRTDGTRILIDAARAAGAQRILAQSIAFA
jgi:nucleoside-diphosphate-sugar epimerase